MLDPSVNFYDVQDAFDADWQDREVEKGKGFKQFKRWEWFMEPRVYPSGNRFSSMATWDAMQDEMRSMSEGERLAGVWTYFGNTSIPSSGGGAGRINMVRTDPSNPNTYYACAPGGGLWRSTDAGVSWSLLNTDLLASIGVTDVAIDHTDPNTIYIATGDGDAGDTYSLGVLKSNDGGLTWNTTGLDWVVTSTRRINRIIMHPTNNNLLIAATSNGVFKTTDGGATWTQTLAGNYKDIQWKPNTPTTVYLTGNNTEFYRSTNMGDSWVQITSGVPNSGVSRMAIAVSPANQDIVYILAGSSANQGFYGFYRSTDSGQTFTTMANTPNLLGWSENGSDTGGQAWYDLAIAADPFDANTVYVGGVNIWKSTNGGSNWTCNAHWYGAAGLPYVHADNHGFFFIPGTSTMLVGCDGGVFRTNNGGTSYTDISANLEVAQIYRLGTAQTNQNRVITGWQDNGTNLKTGVNWTRVIGGDGFESAIDYTNQDIMYGALYYGGIFKSTNGGGSFTQIVNSGGAGVNSSGAWLTPYILNPNNPNILYVGKSTVYRSNDGGASWTGLGAIAGGNINALAVAKSNSNYIYCSKGNTLYRSTDGNNFVGLTGLPNLYITYIAVDPADANRVWVTLSGYTNDSKVYFSDDAGTTWTNFSTGLPNIPANCIAYHEGSNDALYVGTDAGTYYRDASFASWQPYKDGLPNVVVTELEIHYASNTIVASTYGRGIWHAPLYTLPVTDAGMVSINAPTGTVCATEVAPEITIGNFGSDDLTAVTIEYGIQGGAVNTYNWTGVLTTGEIQVINLPLFDEGIGAFVFEASITNVNGGGLDESQVNDTQSSSYYVTGGTNDVNLALTTDCWGNETSWVVTDADGNEVFSGAGYGNQTTYNITLCLPDGCFTLTVFDSYGDGLAGTLYGCGSDGNYVLTDALGTVLVSMPVANFGTQADHPFCLGGVSPGCDDASACNYDPTATANDGSCVYPGCTNPIACNYDPAAGCEDGGCILPDGCTNPVACNYNPSATCDDGSCIVPDGCTDPSACNFDAAAVCEDGSCIYPPAGYTCDCENLVTANATLSGGNSLDVTFDGAGEPYLALVDLTWTNVAGGGSWPADVALQLTSPGGTCIEWGGYDLAVGCGATLGNFGAWPVAWQTSTSGFYTAVIDLSAAALNGSGTWTLTILNGWASSGDVTYDFAITFEGLCVGPSAGAGCTDPTACNFDPAATIDDGSCLQLDECGNCGGTSIAGCTDPGACNYDASAACDNGSCEYISCAGCTDSTACNYDPSASIDDGSCLQLDECGNCGGNSIAGCTDPGACNYNPAAACDDASCEFMSCLGCTDPTACNWDPSASIDDGSCVSAIVYYADTDGDGYGDEFNTTIACTLPVGYVNNSDDCDDTNENVYPGAPGTAEGIDNNCNSIIDTDEAMPCLGDMNNDGNRDVADLLMMLGDYGCVANCTADLNDDGVVNTGDMLQFLSFFGIPCQ